MHQSAGQTCPDEALSHRPRPLQPPPDAHTVAGKVICGYQGWFGTPTDASGEHVWRHWGGGSPEHLDRVSFELYPDIREYSDDQLHPTGYRPHGNGQRSALFSAYSAETVNTHFRWMAEYGIDGVAVQRFFGDIPSPRMRQVMQNVRQAAEAYGRVFYICYDISGGGGEHFVSRMKEDIDRLREWVVDSPAYLHEGDRPVLQIWGFGVKGNCRCEPEQAVQVARYAREQGFYLIAGTPAQFREGGVDSRPEFAPVYDLFDMISPWQVGRFRRCEQVAPYYDERLRPDGEYCAARGQGYMPVLYAGFAWSLWLNGPANAIPRLGGRFLWEQVKAMDKIKTTALYIAMFDEYDESTAIMKAAEDSSQIPQGRYFLTTCADGTFVSGDFYLRLVGKLTALYRDGAPIPDEVPVPLADGPVYWRSGFEEKTDAMPTVTRMEMQGAHLDARVMVTEQAHTGRSALQVSAWPRSKEDNHALLGLIDLGGLKATPGLTLRVYVRALNAGGRRVVWDAQTSDGEWLSQTDAAKLPGIDPEQDAVSSGEWEKLLLPIGRYLEGKAIQTIALRVQDLHANGMLLIDDVLLYE
ncbi:MAG: glycoside hydrolase family 71/99-like protein [Acutalibacteraceae bacterium]|jgi:hypothetical protein